MQAEELIELRFRLYDGSDIGPIQYSSDSTVAMLKERILSDWPKDKKIMPMVANDVKLISGGKFLENNKTLAQCRPPFGELPAGVITMHAVVQTDKKMDELPKKKMCGCSESRATLNVTVIGSVFCDSCSEGTFSKRSYFLQGARVFIQCRFQSREGITSITSNETTDKYGVYKLCIPQIEGFKCREGQDKSSPCHATLLESPSSLCNLKGLHISTTHLAIQPPKSNLCILNLNSVSYRPRRRNAAYCGPHNKSLSSASLDSSSFFFWPLIPPFLLPWLHWPPLPSAFPPLPFPFPFNTVPLPDPTSLPFFSLPPWLIPFLNPSSLPFPFSLFPPSTPPPAPAGP